MFINKLLFAALLLFISPFIVSQTDSTKLDDGEWEWYWEDYDDWEYWDLEFGFKEKRPAISLNYGFAELSREDVQSQFVDPNLIELKIGFIRDRQAWESESIIKHSYKYLFLSNESNNLSGKEATGNEIESKMWRFGYGNSSGYGYKVGESASIIPYYTYTINWTNIDFNNPGNLAFVPEADQIIMGYYDESFRFGTSTEGGVRAKLIKNLILDAGYERAIVFQRHLFWKWAGSAVIESIAQSLVDEFVEEVFDSSPAAAPIVSFLLKNGLAYGIYELRQDKMNWPFPSEAPVSYDQFKFGVTFVF